MTRRLRGPETLSMDGTGDGDMSEPAEPGYPQALIEADEPAAQELTDALFDLGAAGVELRDETTLYKGPGPGRVLLVASFESEARAEQAATALHRPANRVQARAEVLIGDGWKDRYKEFFRPLKLTSSVTVAPPWEPYQAGEGEQVLVMDPGRAFGTGLHGTTVLVATSLERHRPMLLDAQVLDVGTGSGILGLLALLLGAARAVMTDNDPIAVEVAEDNAARNGLSARASISTASLEQIRGEFPRIVANIRAPVLIDMAPLLFERLAPGGLLSLSGVLRSERAEVEQAYREVGGAELSLAAVTEQGDEQDAWICLDWLRR